MRNIKQIFMICIALCFIFFPLVIEKGILNPVSAAPFFNLKQQEDISYFRISESEEEKKSRWIRGWSERIFLAIDHTKIGAPLTDFPVLIHLSSASGINKADVSAIFNTLGNSGKKIAVTTGDGVTQCYVEIESWDSASKQAYLWVRVPVISNTADTILYLYYDRNQSDNSAYVGYTGELAAQKVWDEHFVMVQHFAQSGSGAPGEYVDSTSHRNNGQGGSGLGYTTPAAVLGNTVIGYAQYFNGRSDYINFPDSDDFSISTTGHLTISLWLSPAVLKFTNSKQYIRWMGKGAPGQAEWQFIMYNYGGKGDDGRDRSQWVSFYVCNPSGGAGAGGGGSAGYIDPDSWLFVTATTDMKKSYGFFNGVRSPLSDEWSQYNIQYQNGDDPVRIGTDYMGDDDWWNGRIDEVRFSNVTRSDAWIRADYYSQKDSLLNYIGFHNHMPVFDHLENIHTKEGEFISFSVSATDPAGDLLTFSATNLPPGAVFDPVGKVFFWRPEAGQSGEYEIYFQVSDGLYFNQTKVIISVDRASNSIINNNSSQDKNNFFGLLIVIISIFVFRIVSAFLILALHTFRKL